MATLHVLKKKKNQRLSSQHVTRNCLEISVKEVLKAFMFHCMHLLMRECIYCLHAVL